MACSRTQWPLESRVKKVEMEDTHTIIGKFEFNKMCVNKKKKRFFFKPFQKNLKGKKLKLLQT